MKQPRLKDVVIDAKGTDRMRSRIAKAKKLKITINIDEDLIAALRLRSEKTGVPYQNLLNRVLRSALASKRSDDSSRIDRLEKEVATLRKKISA